MSEISLGRADMASRKVLAQFYMTMDGVASIAGDRDGATEDSTDFWEAMWAGHWDSIDTLLLGRRTYQLWSSFWPGVRKSNDAGKYEREFSAFADRAEKVVFSRTLEAAPWERSRIIRGDISKEVERLKSLPGGNMALGGGPRLFQEFLRLGLIDELRLAIQPSVVGRGKPTFDVERLPDDPEEVVPLGAPLRHDFRLVETKPLKSGSVFVHYSAARR
jgi:dihydrofolate reductase